MPPLRNSATWAVFHQWSLTANCEQREINHREKYKTPPAGHKYPPILLHTHTHAYALVLSKIKFQFHGLIFQKFPQEKKLLNDNTRIPTSWTLCSRIRLRAASVCKCLLLEFSSRAAVNIKVIIPKKIQTSTIQSLIVHAHKEQINHNKTISATNENDCVASVTKQREERGSGCGWKCGVCVECAGGGI